MFTREQLNWYEKFEKLRLSGKYNMFSPQARISIGLNEDQYTFVMKNYSGLQLEYNKVMNKTD